MADDLHKWACAQDYVALGAGSAGVTVHVDHGYHGVRLAIADTPPDAGHDVFMTVKGGETVSHYELPAGFTVYVRAHAAQGAAQGHYRAYE